MLQTPKQIKATISEAVFGYPENTEFTQFRKGLKELLVALHVNLHDLVIHRIGAASARHPTALENKLSEAITKPGLDEL
jgi:hypothetical protein